MTAKLTGIEFHLVRKLGEVFDEFVSMPQEAPSEHKDFQDAIHLCQRLILARGGRRSLRNMESLLDGYASFADSGSHRGRRVVASVCDSQGSTVPFTVDGFEAAVVQLEDDMTWNIIAESTTDDFAFPNIDPFDTWMDAVLHIKEQE